MAECVLIRCKETLTKIVDNTRMIVVKDGKVLGFTQLESANARMPGMVPTRCV